MSFFSLNPWRFFGKNNDDEENAKEIVSNWPLTSTPPTISTPILTTASTPTPTSTSKSSRRQYKNQQDMEEGEDDDNGNDNGEEEEEEEEEEEDEDDNGNVEEEKKKNHPRDRMSGFTRTENSALSLSTTQNTTTNTNEQTHGRAAFFFKAVRSLISDQPQLYSYLAQAHVENVRDTLILVFHLRNCRSKDGGKGERSLFRLCVEWYKSHGLGHLIEQNLHNVVKFGRWDDVLVCPGGYNYMAEQLLTDYATQMSDDNSSSTHISLAAKWAPSVLSMMAKKNRKIKKPPLSNTSSISSPDYFKMIKAINSILRSGQKSLMGRTQIREAEYRKLLSNLREKLRVVERLMAANRWDEIDFNSVPSNAMHKYGKTKICQKGIKHRKLEAEKVAISGRLDFENENEDDDDDDDDDDDENENKESSGHGAFLRHRKEDFLAWREGLKTGKTKTGELAKINSNQLFPYQVVVEYLCHDKPQDELIEAQWKEIQKNVFGEDLNHGPKDCLFVADVSGSMTSTIDPSSSVTCLDVCVSLSLLGARGCRGPFKNTVMTFSNTPTLVKLNGYSLYDDVKTVQNMNWEESTNVAAVFDTILQRLQSDKSDEPAPKCVVIISDMEFNCCHDANLTNFEEAKKKFQFAGYKLPTLVFWNVQSSSKTQQFPVHSDESGTVLVSGFSPSIMDLFLKGDLQNTTPWTIIRQIIDHDVYRTIVS